MRVENYVERLRQKYCLQDSPLEDDFKYWTQEAINKLLDGEGYYQFMPPVRFSETADAADRLLIVDKDNFRPLYQALRKKWKTELKKNPQARIPKRDYCSNPEEVGAATVFMPDNLRYIICVDPYQFWDTSDEDYRRRAIDVVGSKKEAKRLLALEKEVPFIVHEAIHLFQDKRPGTLFKETAAYFYQVDILKRLQLLRHASLWAKHEASDIQFYNSLLTDFGDIIHCYCFGKEMDQPTWSDLHKEISHRYERYLYQELIRLAHPV